MWRIVLIVLVCVVGGACRNPVEPECVLVYKDVPMRDSRTGYIYGWLTVEVCGDMIVRHIVWNDE